MNSMLVFGISRLCSLPGLLVLSEIADQSSLTILIYAVRNWCEHFDVLMGDSSEDV